MLRTHEQLLSRPRRLCWMQSGDRRWFSRAPPASLPGRLWHAQLPGDCTLRRRSYQPARVERLLEDNPVVLIRRYRGEAFFRRYCQLQPNALVWINSLPIAELNKAMLYRRALPAGRKRALRRL